MQLDFSSSHGPRPKELLDKWQSEIRQQNLLSLVVDPIIYKVWWPSYFPSGEFSLHFWLPSYFTAQVAGHSLIQMGWRVSWGQRHKKMMGNSGAWEGGKHLFLCKTKWTTFKTPCLAHDMPLYWLFFYRYIHIYIIFWLQISLCMNHMYISHVTG